MKQKKVKIRSPLKFWSLGLKTTAFALADKAAGHIPHTEGQRFLTFLLVLKESLPFLRAAVLSFSDIA